MVERHEENARAGAASGDVRGVAAEDHGYGRASSCRRRR